MTLLGNRFLASVIKRYKRVMLDSDRSISND